MERKVSRIMPQAPPEAFKSYQILAPPATHFRPASCEEFGCRHYLNGWVTRIDESTELGKQQAYYIRNQSGRRYNEERHGPLTDFTFEAGQRCFKSDSHRLRLERPEIYVVRDGDWRSSTNRRVHASAEDWVDDFKTHQDQIADLRQKG